MNDYEYLFLGDEIFDCLPRGLLDKTGHQKVIASDLARLLVLKDALNRGYEAVIWLDADFLIFNPAEFVIPDEPYAVGREIWVQNDGHGKFKVYKKVHNAFLMFRQGNHFLNFYSETAERLLLLNQGTMPPQYIGPKLLTAIHNVAILPVMESAGMLSPAVIKGILGRECKALELFVNNSTVMIAAANLCASSCDKNEVSEMEIQQLIEALNGGVLTQIEKNKSNL